jgi:hypothetical protein
VKARRRPGRACAAALVTAALLGACSDDEPSSFASVDAIAARLSAEGLGCEELRDELRCRVLDEGVFIKLVPPPAGENLTKGMTSLQHEICRGGPEATPKAGLYFALGENWIVQTESIGVAMKIADVLGGSARSEFIRCDP